MVSPADYKVFNSDTPISSAVHFPYFAATAWYYKLLDNQKQSKTLEEYLPAVENFTINKLIPALSRGNSLSDKKKEELAHQMSCTKQDILMEQQRILTPNIRCGNLIRVVK